MTPDRLNRQQKYLQTSFPSISADTWNKNNPEDWCIEVFSFFFKTVHLERKVHSACELTQTSTCASLPLYRRREKPRDLWNGNNWDRKERHSKYTNTTITTPLITDGTEGWRFFDGIMASNMWEGMESPYSINKILGLFWSHWGSVLDHCK